MSVSRFENAKDYLIFSKGAQTNAKDSLDFSKDAKHTKGVKDGKADLAKTPKIPWFFPKMPKLMPKIPWFFPKMPKMPKIIVGPVLLR